VVYKVDRLSRSLLDFSRLMEVFEQRGVSFVSVTQDFNTTTSMGRLTLNILLSSVRTRTNQRTDEGQAGSGTAKGEMDWWHPDPGI
jgi:DNA invertase Pin-like site-specific DNA recombinase